MKTAMQSIYRAVLIAFVCSALWRLAPNAFGVVPAPDGGYPGGNTAEGQNALFSLTTGGYNTAVGYLSLRSDTTGQFNTAVGAGTLLFNIGDQSANEGMENTAVGAVALLFNTTGSSNSALGSRALENNTTGSFNTATGVAALFSNTIGGLNTATGVGALYTNTEGYWNTATGISALLSNTTGYRNVAAGVNSLLNNTTGHDNTATGTETLALNTTGNYNTATGVNALFSNTTGNDNTATGENALSSNTTGGFNTATGLQALLYNTTGNDNTATGRSALFYNTTGGSNTAIGLYAGFNQTTGSNNVYIGANMEGVAGENDACYIASIFGQTSTGGAQVLINSNGKLGTATSSRRFKQEIEPMDQASQIILALRPVSFRYKTEIDPKGTRQFGLVAEEVEKVNPGLVVRDKDGKPYSVRYDQVNAMLLNEFLKEHKKVEQLQATVARQQSQFEAISAQHRNEIHNITTQLKEQAVQIQKVSARLELHKPAQQPIARGR